MDKLALIKPKTVVWSLAVVYVLKKLLNLTKALAWRHRMNKKYPGPPINPILGNLMDLHAAGGFGVEFFQKMHAKYGPVFRFWLGPFDLQLSTTDSRVINQVHKKGDSRPKITGAFLNFLGDESLVLMEGCPKLKQIRLKYGELVQSKEIFELVVSASQRIFADTFEFWGQRVEGVDVHKETREMMYKIMGMTFFGKFFDSQRGEDIKKHHWYCLENAARWGFLPFKPWFISGFREYEWNKQQLHEKVNKCIEDLKANQENECDGKGLYMALNDPYFEGKRTIVMVSLINGAYDTCYSAINWNLFFLAQHPKFQEELREEIFAKIGTLEKVPNFKHSDLDASNMPFLDLVIKESLRMRPTVPINQRVSYHDDYVVSSTGLVIPKGVSVNVLLHLNFRDTDVYGPDADTFNPHRFKSDEIRAAFIPFGGGSRMCVGMMLGTSELKALLVTLLRRYKFQLRDPNDVGEFIFEAGTTQPKGFLVDFTDL